MISDIFCVRLISREVKLIDLTIWQNQKPMLKCYAISYVWTPAASSSVDGEGVRIDQDVEILTTPMNANQEKKL